MSDVIDRLIRGKRELTSTIAEQLTAMSTESLMRLQAEISDEIERRYRQAKREQNARADELKRQSPKDGAVK